MTVDMDSPFFSPVTVTIQVLEIAMYCVPSTCAVAICLGFPTMMRFPLSCRSLRHYHCRSFQEIVDLVSDLWMLHKYCATHRYCSASTFIDQPPWEPTHTVPPLDTINLTNLHTLMTTDAFITVIRLMERLHLPMISCISVREFEHDFSDIRMEHSNTYHHITQEDLRRVLNRIWDFATIAEWELSQGTDTEIRDMFDGRHHFVVTMSSTAVCGRKSAFRIEADIVPDKDWSSLCNESVQLLRLHQVTEFAFESRDHRIDPTSGEVLNILRLLPNVKILHLMVRGAISVLTALLHAESEGMALCPKLETVVLDHADVYADIPPARLSHSSRIAMLEQLLPVPKTQFWSLTNVLEGLAAKRAKAGRQISIHLRKCNMNGSPITTVDQLDHRLRDIVHTLAPITVMGKGYEWSVPRDLSDMGTEPEPIFPTRVFI
jgi:hypothetical protein